MSVSMTAARFVVVDPAGNTASSPPLQADGPGLSDVLGGIVPGMILHGSALEDVLLERAAFASLSESTFAVDWSSEADSIYDDL